MSELYETDFVAEDEDGVEFPLFETEDGELVDANGEFFGTVEDAEQDDEPEGYDPDAEFVAQVQAMVANEVAAATNGYSRLSYVEPDSGEEFEGEFHDMVAKLERERGARLLDSERDALWEAATKASEDPTVSTDAEVWRKAKEAVGEDITAADYIDSRMRESDERQEEQEKDEPIEEQTAKEFLADIEQDQEAYREAIEAAVAGEGPSPFDDYEHPEGD